MTECSVAHYGIEKAIRCAHYDGRYVAYGPPKSRFTLCPESWYVLTTGHDSRHGLRSTAVSPDEADRRFDEEEASWVRLTPELRIRWLAESLHRLR